MTPSSQLIEEQRRHAEEFEKAGTRIRAQRGVYRERRPAALVWLLAFAQEDAATYSFGKLSDRWEEVKRFAKDGGLGPEKSPLSHHVEVRLALPGRFASPYTATRPFPGPGERDVLQTLQADIKTSIDAYLAQGWARTGKYELDVIVRKEAPRVYVVADIYPSFLYQAFHLLGEIGPRIRKCRKCQHLFLAARSDKEFCSGTCQAMMWKDEHLKPKDEHPSKKKKTKPKGRQLQKGRTHHGKKR